MRFTNQIPFAIVFIIVLFTLSSMPSTAQQMKVAAYFPSVGHQTEYEYGVICNQPNQTATNILFWTGLTLGESNYSLVWHQYVNLTISVTSLTQVGSNIHAFYNFSVTIHSNKVIVSNSSWQIMLNLDGSVQAPASTGVSNGLFHYPITEGLPGFFLDDSTLDIITIGNNVLIGCSYWQRIEPTTFIITGSEQPCYRFVNSSSTLVELVQSTFVIDQDVGIYYRANETRLFSIGSIQQSRTAYYQVQSTNAPLTPAPEPLFNLIITSLVIIAPTIIIVLVIRVVWSRRQQ